ncbi:STAS domain-containing protein [Ramlibacter sp. AW1]|uniref:STAS domain-containing protein n=1 Tax=Ramlibacter aurantiacus TaxID=2801330 RepID=A0A937D327_9BURK|nr:STAS domain-containing protein [Ramlibacter aurantiacus]MBL0422224.1 STAS domain-containing protein [Ramlibacter aurantiacus]
MADPKGDNPSLFAKVIKFVRSPATSWGGLDLPEESQDSGYNKQLLKEMIERKRRNDFVRRREFDVLRKLRRNEAVVGHDAAARPSFFHSSMPSRPDDRASTLKKIDEIEAQMSQQWWKTKSVDPTVTDGLNTGSATLVSPSPAAAARAAFTPSDREALATAHRPPNGFTAALPLASQDLRPPLSTTKQTSTDWNFDTLPSGGDEDPAAPAVPSATESFPSFSVMSMGSAVAAIEVDEFVHDAQLEDAAIRFAHGDDAGAEAALRELLQSGGSREQHEDTWLALFDLYRATGQQGRFDEAALEFVNRFGRSAPQWLSLPQLASRPPPPAGAAAPAAARPPEWACPPVLAPQTLVALQNHLARATQPWRLSWSRLNRIEPQALEALTRLFTQWASQAVRLHFVDAEKLDALLRQHTVSGDRNAGAGWWKLRMEVLRVMHRPDEFELVALDYCVTFEVSPPSWESPRCHCRSSTADGTETGVISSFIEAFGDSSVSASLGFGDTAVSSRMHRPVRAELTGILHGDAAIALDRLSQVLPGELLVISCARLLRVDFAAAGSLLNWATARHSEGCSLQFTDVHRLLAPFFGVVGIPAAARIAVRRD